MIFTQLSLQAPLSVIASPFLLSLRAERGNLGEVPDCGACSEPKPERREEPSEESRLGIASALACLAMTERGHCERSVAISAGQGIALALACLAMTEGGHCKRSVAISAGQGIASALTCLAMTERGVIASGAN